MAQTISASSPPAALVKTFYNTVFMYPTFEFVMLNNDLIHSFPDRIQVFRIFAKHASAYDSVLKGLGPLLNQKVSQDPMDDGEGMDILQGIVDIQINKRTLAMNK